MTQIPDDILTDIRLEFSRATTKHGKFNSAHEGYAVLLEEVDELWEEVKKQYEKRDSTKLREEAVQVAAMAIRFIVDGGF
jgi:NTP pyrophosphatase (non-canonical NTP hydrolase)